MKKLIPLCILSAGLVGFATAGVAADQKIATMNLRKAFENYYKTAQSTAVIKQEAAEDQSEHSQMVDNEKKHEDDWRKLIDKANDQAVSAEERDKSKKAASDLYAELETDKESITQFDRMASSKLQEKERQRIEDIVHEIQGVVEAKAKAAGYTMVLDSSGLSVNQVPTPLVLYTNGQDDLTDAVIKELNAAAPPGAFDTNAVAAPAPSNLINISPNAPK